MHTDNARSCSVKLVTLGSSISKYVHSSTLLLLKTNQAVSLHLIIEILHEPLLSINFQISTALATTLEFIGQVAGTPFDRQDLEKKDASSETKSNLDATATVLEKRAAEPGTAESNDQVVEVRDVPD